MKKIILIFLFIAGTDTFTQYYYNQWANFDGVNDYLAASDNTDIILDSAFTIEGWIFVQDTTGTNKTILSKVNSSLSDGYALLVQGSGSSPGNAGKLQLNLNGGNYTFIQTASTRLALNGWSHFAVTFRNASPNNDTVRFYINGTLIQSFYSNIAPLANTTDSLRVGNCYSPGSYSNGLRGRLDNLRIYKTQKSATVIANNRGIPLSMEFTSNIDILNGAQYFSYLSASWNFDGNGNETVGSYNSLISSNGAYYSGNGFNPDNYRLQSNYYLRFPGTSWLSQPDATNSVFDLDTAFTIEAWVYIDAYRASPQTIISKGTSGYSYVLSIASSPANSPVLILNSGSKFLQSSRPVLARNWNHIAATYRSSTGLMELIVNGISDTSRVTSPGSITVSNDSVYIGRNLFGEYMYGDIDAVKISKYVKSQQEILSMMYTSQDNMNFSGNPLLNASYNFEGNTTDNISSPGYFIPRGNVYFERLNTTSGAGGASQAPLIRTSNNDGGFAANSYYMNSQRIYAVNGATVRDSILISGISGTNRITAVVLMNHTNATDVTLNLRAPNGTSVNLIAATGSTNNDIMTVFDDLADTLINTSLVPFSMRIKPALPLAALPQTNQNGYWRLSVTDNSAAADSGRVYMWGIKFIPTVGITQINETAGSYFLGQNYPNPFNPSTKIRFGIPTPIYPSEEGKKDSPLYFGEVRLIIYDILGREISTLVNGYLKPGEYEVEWPALTGGNAKDYPSGIYFYTLKTENYTKTQKMVLIK